MKVDPLKMIAYIEGKYIPKTEDERERFEQERFHVLARVMVALRRKERVLAMDNAKLADELLNKVWAYMPGGYEADLVDVAISRLEDM